MRRRYQAIASLGAAVAMLAATPAMASASQLTIRSVELSRGTVVVDVRLKCDGGGTMAWDVAIDQGKRSDQAKGRLRCDGVRKDRTLTLVPDRGRFRPGQALLTYGTIGPCTPTVCIGWAVAEPVALSYR